MVSKSVAAPGVLDALAGDSFAWLTDSPTVMMGLSAAAAATVAFWVWNLVSN